MKRFSLHRTQKLGITLDNAWDFFKNPLNLKEITPDHLGFDIVSKELPDEIAQGMLIEYRVKPILGIPLKWVSKISHVNRPFEFTDKQIKGPYRMWEHRHTFTAIDEGVLVTDEVHYSLPFNWLGGLLHPVIVKPQLERIFDYRFNYLKEKFPIKI